MAGRPAQLTPSPLPVLFLARGGDIDGQQRQVLYLAAGLAQQNAILTTALSEPGNLLTELLALKVDTRVARMSPWRSVGHFIDRYLDARHLLNLARERNTRVVHAHDVWRAEFAPFIAKQLTVPYVVHVRGPLSPRDIKKHRLRLADCVICIAQRYVDDLIQAGIEPSRIVLIDDAVNLELFGPGSRLTPATFSAALVSTGVCWLALLAGYPLSNVLASFLKSSSDYHRTSRAPLIS